MKNILLIEPNIALARLYKEMFIREGFGVTHVVGAQAAVDAADKTAPDAVVLELQLSRHSGVEFLHEFRSYPEWWPIPIIVNTNILPAKMAQLQTPLRDDLGVRDILYKPKTSLQALVQAVRAHTGTA